MTTSRAQHTSQLVWGGILLIFGTALLLNNLGLLDILLREHFGVTEFHKLAEMMNSPEYQSKPNAGCE